MGYCAASLLDRGLKTHRKSTCHETEQQWRVKMADYIRGRLAASRFRIFRLPFLYLKTIILPVFFFFFFSRIEPWNWTLPLPLYSYVALTFIIILSKDSMLRNLCSWYSIAKEHTKHYMRGKCKFSHVQHEKHPQRRQVVGWTYG
jgi:hypothetical protein